jgi:hypothetical protein
MKLNELLREDEEDHVDPAVIADEQGFAKSHEKINVSGKRKTVTTLTKIDTVGGIEVEMEYIINPETGAWVFKAGIPGHAKVEFKTGEDSSSLVRHLKKKKKITAHQAVENLSDREV